VILLTSTSDKLRLTTAAAAVSVDVHASYFDLEATDEATPLRKNTAIVSATTTDIVESPAAGKERKLKLLTVRNKHAAIACDVTVIHTDGTTAVELHKVTLAPGEMLQYVEGLGFVVL
jgi:hypothetical protein